MSGYYNKIPNQLKLYLEEADIKTLEECFTITQPDCLGKIPIKQLAIVGNEWDIRDVFRKLGSKFNSIKSLNDSWSKARINKKPHQCMVKIIIYWDQLSHSLPPKYGLVLEGIAAYIESSKQIDNFKYSLEALKEGYIVNPDLRKAIELDPWKNWSEDIVKEIYGRKLFE